MSFLVAMKHLLPSQTVQYIHLKYEAKTLKVQQFQTLILIRDRTNKSSISFDSSSEERYSFEKCTSRLFHTHAICSVSLILFGK